MILLRPRKRFETQRRKRFAIVKVTQRERAVNFAAREALVDSLSPIIEDLIEDFRLDADSELQARLKQGLSPGIPTQSLSGFQQSMRTQLNEAMLSAVDRGGQIGLRFAGAAGSAVPQDLVTTAARNWMESEGAKRIAGITDGQRLLVARQVKDVLSDFDSFGEATDRIARSVGLTARDATALRNFELKRIGQLIPTPEADTQFIRETIAQEVEDRRKTMVRNRARTIAETEMQNAIQEGELRYWDAAVASGEVDEAKVGKRWFTVGDNDVCPICRPLIGQIKPLHEPFTSLGFTGQRPPAHVRCRCFMQFATDADFDEDEIEQVEAETIIPEPAPVQERPGGLPPARDSIDPAIDFDAGTPEKLQDLIPAEDILDDDEDLGALEEYTESGYIDMNRALRGQEITGESFIGPQQIDELNERMFEIATDPGVALPLGEDITMYRGLDIQPEDFGNFEVGHVYTDDAFGSFSPNRKIAGNFARDHAESEILRVRMPRGQNGLWIGGNESEWIMRPGSRYRIVSVEDDIHITDVVRFKEGVRTVEPLRRKVITLEVLEPAPKRLRRAFGGMLAEEAGFTFD